MAFLPNICACPVKCGAYFSGVNLRNRLCGVQKYASVQFLDFLDLEQKFSFLDWKLSYVQDWFVDGHYVDFFPLIKA